MKGIAQGCWR